MPVTARPWRLVMGLRPLDPARWLEVDGHRAAELRLKYRLMGSDGGGPPVFAALPGSEPACRELLGLVVDDLAEHHPGLVTALPDRRFREETTGLVAGGPGAHPLDVAARLVQEDLCAMMMGKDNQWVLGAASVCFPSRWSLADKMGKNLSGIHQPVPGYEEKLAAPTAAAFDRLRPERPVWRLNWTLLTDPALHQPGGEGRGRRHPPVADPGAQLWFRVERQTIRRLRSSPAAVFTIRTYVATLGEVVGRYPDAAGALSGALAEVPAGVDEYKGWAQLRPAVLAWLAARHPR